jgi:hypothetical protein
VNLAGGAAAFRGLADRAESDLALEACGEAARDYLAVLRQVTPKRSGRLADSETVTGPSGGGLRATALVGPHVIYAAFREHGGTIHVRNAKVLTDGVSFFGRSVTQAGARYMEKAEGPGSAAVAHACRVVAVRFFTL